MWLRKFQTPPRPPVKKSTGRPVSLTPNPSSVGRVPPHPSFLFIAPKQQLTSPLFSYSLFE